MSSGVAVGPADEAAFRARVREALDDPRAQVGLARIEFDRLDRVAEFFGEAVAEFVSDELVLRLADLAGDPGWVFGPPGGTALILVPIPARDTDALDGVAWEVMDRLSAPIDVGTGQVSIGCTVGLAEPGILAEKSVAGLVSAASAACRRAAAMGSRQAATFEGIRELTGRRGILDRTLIDGLAADEIRPWFRPRVRLADGVIVAAVAQARWQHPLLGSVSAGEFVPEARRSGLIREIDRRVQVQALRMAAAWPAAVGLVIRHSGVGLGRPGVVPDLAEALAESGVSPDRVTVEVEAAAARSMRPDRLAALRDLGVRLAFGDLASFHASIDVLDAGLFDGFTIDPAFVRGPHGRPSERALAGLVEFGSAYGLQAVAAGIETPDEQRAVVASGCLLGQGDLLHPAMPEDVLREVLGPSDYQG